MAAEAAGDGAEEPLVSPAVAAPVPYADPAVAAAPPKKVDDASPYEAVDDATFCWRYSP